MSGIWISAVPEIRLNTEHVLKGKTPRSRKTALCDVKNTLLNKASSTSNEPLRKVECGQATKSNISSKIPVKEFVKKTPAQSVLKQEGTFTIAQESGCWNGSCDHSEDNIFELRRVSDQLRHEDIKYTSKGLLTLPLLEKEHLDIDIMKENLEILPSWSKNVSAFDSMMIY